MKIVPIRDAAADLSALIDAAERGEPTTITRHGRPAAVMVSVDDARTLYDADKPSFADFLLSFPGDGVAFERDQTPTRSIDL
jgi:prevent-host-death family protein